MRYELKNGSVGGFDQKEQDWWVWSLDIPNPDIHKQ